MASIPRLGVAICTFNSADVILDCLESLLASTDVDLTIVVADNASTDGTVLLLRNWAMGAVEYVAPSNCPFDFRPITRVDRVSLQGLPIDGCGHRVYLIETGVNGGFAAGVNAALAKLATDDSIDRFWVLNPDTMVPPETAHAFATWHEDAESPNQFALMGGRVAYFETPDQIQIDGGTINSWTGVTGNLNLGAPRRSTPPVEHHEIDFVTGASMVASRSFYDSAGPLREHFFLYYEEVDWALRRGALPLRYCRDGLVFHRAGTSIGSPTLGRPASAFSLYFKYRSRIRFVREHFPGRLPVALLYSFAKAAQLLLKGYPVESWTIISGSCGFQPSRAIRDRLSSQARERAFPRKK